MPAAALRFSQSLVGQQDYTSGIRFLGSTPGWKIQLLSTSNSTGTIYFTPFICTYTHTFTGISFVNGNSMNGLKVRMGIYTSVARSPAARVLDAGELTISDASTNTTREITISQQLMANTMYWLAWTCDTNGASVYVPDTLADYDLAAELGTHDPAAGDYLAFRKMSQAYGALPANASSVTSQNAKAGCPTMWLKG